MTRRKVTRTQDGGAAAKGAGSRNTASVVLVLVGVLVVAGIFAVVLTSGNDGGGDAEAVAGTVSVTGGSLPLPEDPDPAVGMAAPAVSGEDFTGAPVSIGSDGRAKAIVFLAHWCPHCQAEVPVIQGWVDSGGVPADVDLYSVATSNDPSQPNYPPDTWLQGEGWTVPVLVDDAEDTVGRAFGVSAFPFFVFVDAEGSVAARATGELSIEQLETYLAAIGG